LPLATICVLILTIAADSFFLGTINVYLATAPNILINSGYNLADTVTTTTNNFCGVLFKEAITVLAIDNTLNKPLYKLTVAVEVTVNNL